ncbi:TRAP transporter substrate-binding protein DctP [Psychrobacillus sp. OK032]|uniref:TRAP transporter substrate-binding protein DctP n=1 Tax=Psychrobacillus sp. OK032 TaxID=1884358 RepID=UPI0008B60BB7|nr:TRAP transporter substrate-binding protein DctP [Psychrobacillus sp. OK032]SER82514.1 TRAP-type C4-dicarboxylate transport system, substrate-binding protein [Psychrobacillus sp. OK032]
MNSITNKWMFFLLIFMLVFGLVACGSENMTQAGNDTVEKSNEKVVIKIADTFPTTHLISTMGASPWIERIEELGEGKIEVEYYPAGQLGKVGSMLDNLKNKVVDISYIQQDQFEHTFPLSNIGGNLGLVNDAISGSKAYNKLVQEDLYELEYKPNGIKPLWTMLTQSNQIINSKHPVKTIEDFKGLKVQASNAMQEQLMHDWGATPVLLPGSELYSSWERGILDGTLISFLSWPGYQLDTIAKYTTVNAPLSRGNVAYFVNEEVWNSWPEEVQDAVWQASQEIVEQLPGSIVEHQEELIKQYEKETEIEFYEIPEEELQKWNEKFQSYNNEWAENLDSKGSPGTEILEKFTKYNEEFSK